MVEKEPIINQKHDNHDNVIKIPITVVHEHEQHTPAAAEHIAQEAAQPASEEMTEPASDSKAEQSAENPAVEQTAEPQPVSEQEDDLSRVKKQLTAKEQEAKKYYDIRLRLQAEFDNFRKRKEKEILEFRKYANEGLMRDILPVIEDFERAIASAEQTHKLEDFLKGIEMVFTKFQGILQKKGLKEIEAKGMLFNPEIHEAVMQIESDEVEEGMVAAVFQKGYYLHDRVLVAPKVGVARKK